MVIMSNKRNALNELFKVLDCFQYGRVDTLELLAVILISLEGKFDIILQNIMGIFGFCDPQEFHIDEFHYFLDCLFRGMLKLAIPKKERRPINGGKKIPSNEVNMLVMQIFPKDVSTLKRIQFVEQMTQ
mmetsp:Transcript_32269/g.31559  ORF Transcript_32269/g.31559 Transcript_32269/m.31559 type:complete len:129 (-) Transcript_32269:588-974(-)